MSEVTKMDKVVEGINDYHESQQDLLIGRVIDIGRLFYIKLSKAVEQHKEVTDVEVVWLHNTKTLIGLIEADETVFSYSVQESEADARSERLSLIDNAILSILNNAELV